MVTSRLQILGFLENYLKINLRFERPMKIGILICFILNCSRSTYSPNSVTHYHRYFFKSGGGVTR